MEHAEETETAASGGDLGPASVARDGASPSTDAHAGGAGHAIADAAEGPDGSSSREAAALATGSHLGDASLALAAHLLPALVPALRALVACAVEQVARQAAAEAATQSQASTAAARAASVIGRLIRVRPRRAGGAAEWLTGRITATATGQHDGCVWVQALFLSPGSSGETLWLQLDPLSPAVGGDAAPHLEGPAPPASALPAYQIGVRPVWLPGGGKASDSGAAAAWNPGMQLLCGGGVGGGGGGGGHDSGGSAAAPASLRDGALDGAAAWAPANLPLPGRGPPVASVLTPAGVEDVALAGVRALDAWWPANVPQPARHGGTVDPDAVITATTAAALTDLVVEMDAVASCQRYALAAALEHGLSSRRHTMHVKPPAGGAAAGSHTSDDIWRHMATCVEAPAVLVDACRLAGALDASAVTTLVPSLSVPPAEVVRSLGDLLQAPLTRDTRSKSRTMARPSPLRLHPSTDCAIVDATGGVTSAAQRNFRRGVSDALVAWAPARLLRGSSEGDGASAGGSERGRTKGPGGKAGRSDAGSQPVALTVKVPADAALPPTDHPLWDGWDPVAWVGRWVGWWHYGSGASDDEVAAQLPGRGPLLKPPTAAGLSSPLASPTRIGGVRAAGGEPAPCAPTPPVEYANRLVFAGEARVTGQPLSCLPSAFPTSAWAPPPLTAVAADGVAGTVRALLRASTGGVPQLQVAAAQGQWSMGWVAKYCPATDRHLVVLDTPWQVAARLSSDAAVRSAATGMDDALTGTPGVVCRAWLTLRRIVPIVLHLPSPLLTADLAHGWPAPPPRAAPAPWGEPAAGTAAAGPRPVCCICDQPGTAATPLLACATVAAAGATATPDACCVGHVHVDCLHPPAAFSPAITALPASAVEEVQGPAAWSYRVPPAAIGASAVLASGWLCTHCRTCGGCDGHSADGSPAARHASSIDVAVPYLGDGQHAVQAWAAATATPTWSACAGAADHVRQVVGAMLEVIRRVSVGFYDREGWLPGPPTALTRASLYDRGGCRFVDIDAWTGAEPPAPANTRYSSGRWAPLSWGLHTYTPVHGTRAMANFVAAREASGEREAETRALAARSSGKGGVLGAPAPPLAPPAIVQLLCGPCTQRIAEGAFCPVCHAIYADDAIHMAGCDVCDGWIHGACDDLSERDMALMAAGRHPLWGKRYVCPLCRHNRMTSLLARLRDLDVMGYFAFPVTEAAAPGYFNVIAQPMDMWTMSAKLDAGDYDTAGAAGVSAFRADFELIVRNTVTFNTPQDLVYHDAIRWLREGTQAFRLNLPPARPSAHLVAIHHVATAARDSDVWRGAIAADDLAEAQAAMPPSAVEVARSAAATGKRDGGDAPHGAAKRATGKAPRGRPPKAAHAVVEPSRVADAEEGSSATGGGGRAADLAEEAADAHAGAPSGQLALPDNSFPLSSHAFMPLLPRAAEAVALSSREACAVCGTLADASSMVCCTDCGEAFHLYCVSLPHFIRIALTAASHATAELSTWIGRALGGDAAGSQLPAAAAMLREVTVDSVLPSMLSAFAASGGDPLVQDLPSCFTSTATDPALVHVFATPAFRDAMARFRRSWRCPSCKVCETCGECRPEHEDRLLVCDGCDAGFHMFCVDEPLLVVPEGQWFCDSCVVCDNPACPRGGPSAAAADVSHATLVRPAVRWSLFDGRCRDCCSAAARGRLPGLPLTPLPAGFSPAAAKQLAGALAGGRAAGRPADPVAEAVRGGAGAGGAGALVGGKRASPHDAEPVAVARAAKRGRLEGEGAHGGSEVHAGGAAVPAVKPPRHSDAPPTVLDVGDPRACVLCGQCGDHPPGLLPVLAAHIQQLVAPAAHDPARVTGLEGKLLPLLPTPNLVAWSKRDGDGGGGSGKDATAHAWSTSSPAGWVHMLCAVWSNEAFERVAEVGSPLLYLRTAMTPAGLAAAGDSVPGPTAVPDVPVHGEVAVYSSTPATRALMLHQVCRAVARGLTTRCASCGHVGATLNCATAGCGRTFHVRCAVVGRCLFTQAKAVHCAQHAASAAAAMGVVLLPGSALQHGGLALPPRGFPAMDAVTATLLQPSSLARLRPLFAASNASCIRVFPDWLQQAYVRETARPGSGALAPAGLLPPGHTLPMPVLQGLLSPAAAVLTVHPQLHPPAAAGSSEPPVHDSRALRLGGLTVLQLGQPLPLAPAFTAPSSLLPCGYLARRVWWGAVPHVDASAAAPAGGVTHTLSRVTYTLAIVAVDVAEDAAGSTLGPRGVRPLDFAAVAPLFVIVTPDDPALLICARSAAAAFAQLRGHIARACGETVAGHLLSRVELAAMRGADGAHSAHPAPAPRGRLSWCESAARHVPLGSGGVLPPMPPVVTDTYGTHPAVWFGYAIPTVHRLLEHRLMARLRSIRLPTYRQVFSRLPQSRALPAEHLAARAGVTLGGRSLGALMSGAWPDGRGRIAAAPQRGGGAGKAAEERKGAGDSAAPAVFALPGPAARLHPYDRAARHPQLKAATLLAATARALHDPALAEVDAVTMGDTDKVAVHGVTIVGAEPLPPPPAQPSDADGSGGDGGWAATQLLSHQAYLVMAFRALKAAVTHHRVVVRRSRIHGWGLFLRVPIPRNGMVIEYSGELVRSPVADRREVWYEEEHRWSVDRDAAPVSPAPGGPPASQALFQLPMSRAFGCAADGRHSDGSGSCYLFRLDDEWIVDATKHGSAARFINHSCAPNCYSEPIPVDGRRHIVIFALRDLAAGEEVTYNYKFAVETDPAAKIPCHCGAATCTGTMN